MGIYYFYLEVKFEHCHFNKDVTTMMVFLAFNSCTSREILTTCLLYVLDQMSLSFLQGFHVNDKVLASWSDCRFYPAKVISVNKDGGYQ